MTQAATPKQKRPIAITLVGLIVFFAALYNLALGGLIVWSANAINDPPDFDMEILNARDIPELLADEDVTKVEGILYLVLGAVQMIFCIGFWRIARWAWVGIMTWQVVKMLVDITGFLAPERPVISLMLSILIVFLLNQADVRRVFGIRVQFPGAVTNNATNDAFDRN